jgi:hypothetical protein
MQFETRRSNAGQFDWCLVGDDGAKLAISAAAFGSAQDARHAAADVCLHARSAAGTEVCR